MTVVRSSEIETLLRRGLDPNVAVVLVYGPNTGLVAEQIAAFARLCTAGSDDPFAIVRIDGDVLASDPARLVDEATTFGLFGHARTIQVRSGSRNFAPALERLLALDAIPARVLIESGELNRTAPLRALCERSPRALAIACYADDEQTLPSLVQHALSKSGLAIDTDALDTLVQNLSPDRRVNLAEIDKLALYAHGQARIALADVEAVISDTATATLHGVADAAFAGHRRATEAHYQRGRYEGVDAATVLSTTLRHALTLLQVKSDNPQASPSELLRTWRGLHFKRKSVIERQLTRWRPAELRRAVLEIHETILDCRRSNAQLGHAQAAMRLFDVLARFEDQERTSRS